MAQECNSKVSGMYDVCGARVAVKVDWSNLGALNEKKFKDIGFAVTKCAVPNIPYTPVPEWFKRNPKLVDEHGFQIQKVGNQKKHVILVVQTMIWRR